MHPAPASASVPAAAALSSGAAARSRAAARAARARQRSYRQLLPVVAAAAFLPPFFLLPRPSAIPFGPRMLGAILWVLCWGPAFAYVGVPAKRRAPVPFMPLLGIGYALYYPLQLLVGADNVIGSASSDHMFALDPAVDYLAPASLALVGWLCLLGGAALGNATKRRAGVLPVSEAQSIAIKPLALRLLYVGVFFELLKQLQLVPGTLSGLLLFLINLSLAAGAVLITFWARGELTHAQALRLAVAFAVYGALRLGSGSIAQVLNLLLMGLIASWVGGRRVGVGWLLVAVVGIAGGVAVKGIIADFRRLAWFSEGEKSPLERVALITTLLDDKVHRLGVAETVATGWSAVAGRSAATDILGDVVRRTPEPVPYWGGRTYLSLVGAAVPRVLWPDKPTKDMGQQFGHRYGYLDEEDTYTSINFPTLVECYANFGEVGVIVGMFVVGVILGLLQRMLNVPGQSTVQSAVGVVLLLPLLNIESDFSLVYGGLLLNLASFAVAVRAAKSYVRRRRLRALSPAAEAS